VHELKICFPKYHLDERRPREREMVPIYWYVIVGMFAGASGTYLFEHGFHPSVAAFLSITGVLAGAAISAVLKFGKLDRARRERTRNNAAQIRARWDYRPRNGIQRYGESQGAEPVDALSITGPATHIEDTVWFDFIPIESPATDESTNSLPQIPTTKVP
jgi:hypothetical protein